MSSCASDRRVAETKCGRGVVTLKENLDVTSEFTGIYETILDPTNRLHAEFWRGTGHSTPTSTWSTRKKPCPTISGARLGLRPSGGREGTRTPDLIGVNDAL